MNASENDGRGGPNPPPGQGLTPLDIEMAMNLLNATRLCIFRGSTPPEQVQQAFRVIQTFLDGAANAGADAGADVAADAEAEDEDNPDVEDHPEEPVGTVIPTAGSSSPSSLTSDSVALQTSPSTSGNRSPRRSDGNNAPAGNHTLGTRIPPTETGDRHPLRPSRAPSAAGSASNSTATSTVVASDDTNADSVGAATIGVVGSSDSA